MYWTQNTIHMPPSKNVNHSSEWIPSLRRKESVLHTQIFVLLLSLSLLANYMDKADNLLQGVA